VLHRARKETVPKVESLILPAFTAEDVAELYSGLLTIALSG
jgi:hypothetical protein